MSISTGQQMISTSHGILAVEEAAGAAYCCCSSTEIRFAAASSAIRCKERSQKITTSSASLCRGTSNPTTRPIRRTEARRSLRQSRYFDTVAYPNLWEGRCHRLSGLGHALSGKPREFSIQSKRKSARISERVSRSNDANWNGWVSRKISGTWFRSWLGRIAAGSTHK